MHRPSIKKLLDEEDELSCEERELARRSNEQECMRRKLSNAAENTVPKPNGSSS